MMDRARVVGSGQLENLRGRVERWRAGCGGRRARVPEELWSAAIEVARSEGLYATSRATRLNYGSLKARMGRRGRRGRAEMRVANGGSSPSFVEVAMPVMASREAAGGRTVVELAGRGGERVRVEMTGASTVDVVGLARALWSSER